MIRQRLQIAEEDAAPVAAGKLVAGLEPLLTDPGERAYVAARVAQLLGVDVGGSRPVLPREELFAGWRLFFERLARQGPVVLLVEDLQYADPGLLDFLEHLLDWARDVPIFVLTLARPELQDRRAGWGSGRRNSTTLTLEAMDGAAMDALLDGLVPGIPVAAKTAIAARAQGIPLYAVEMVRMLIDLDVVQPIDGVYRLIGDVGELGVPATLQSLLAARLDALEPDARRLVADAAVLGGSFPAEAVIAVSDLPEPRVRALLDELVRREVLGVRADSLSPERGQYAFVQMMFRQVAYDTLSRRERKARHLVVAAHLQTAFADGGEEIAEVVAAHLLDAIAAVPDDPDVTDIRGRAVATLTRAGERGERTGAPAAAAAAYTTAAELLEQAGSSTEQIAAAGLRERAGMVVAADEPDRAIEHCRRAVELYRLNGRIRDTARANTRLGAALRTVGRLEDARALLRESLIVLEVEPDADSVEATSTLARLEAFAGNPDEADRLSASALAVAQTLDLPDSILAELFTTRGLVHVFANRPAQAASAYREAIRRADNAQASPDSVRALFNLADLLTTIDPPAARDTARSALAHGRRIGSRTLLAIAHSNLLQALLLTGEWDEAEADFHTGAGDDGLWQEPALAYSALQLHAFRGNVPGVQALLPLLERWSDTEDPQELAIAATCRAAAAAAEGNSAVALSEAGDALGHAEALGLFSDGIRWAWQIAADAALALGDRDEVARLLSWLGAHPKGHVPPVLRAERLRIRGRLHACEGEPDATSVFESAVTAFRELGSPYHLAVGLLDYAEHLQATAGPDVALPATEAAAIAAHLRARPLVDRAERLTASLGKTAHEGRSRALLDLRGGQPG
jgi:tetratricopeptide (TPR) repeat protein